MLLELKNILEKGVKVFPKRILVLLMIVIIGIFLRSYNFHSWLDFGSDQVNDAIRVGAVVDGKAPWPEYGPDMGNSGKGGRSNRFRLGPMYYDFEIISAKIFGNKPVAMAYPDLLFSILSLPLFYFFLRRIFSINLSLALTGLYAVSFYALTFSHSAWNVNSIPFFSLLFLLSLYEFILAKEKTQWGWIAALGISLGVSVQLHAILMVLFPATLFFACLIFMRKNLSAWKKLGVVILLMFILNLGQLVGESRSGFKNSKIFLESITGSSTRSSDSLLVKASNNLSCTFQANAYMLSSIGSSDCDFSLSQFVAGGEVGKSFFKKSTRVDFVGKVIICLMFSLIGYGILIKNFKKEKLLKRKYFYGLILLYAGLSFFVMLPVIDTAIRYFVHLFFLPFIFLGLIINFLAQKFNKKYLAIAMMMLIVLVVSNASSIYLEVKNDFVQSRIILGPVEDMVEYMIVDAGTQKEIYLYTDSGGSDYIKSLRYVAAEKNVSLLKAGDGDKISSEKARFYLNTGKGNISATQVNGMNYDRYRVFNQVALFHLTN